MKQKCGVQAGRQVGWLTGKQGGLQRASWSKASRTKEAADLMEACQESAQVLWAGGGGL